MVPVKDRKNITTCVLSNTFDRDFFERKKIKKVSFERDSYALIHTFQAFSGIKQGEREDIVVYVKKIIDKCLWDGAADAFKGRATQYDGLEIIFSYMKYYKDYNIQPEFEF